MAEIAKYNRSCGFYLFKGLSELSNTKSNYYQLFLCIMEKPHSIFIILQNHYFHKKTSTRCGYREFKLLLPNKLPQKKCLLFLCYGVIDYIPYTYLLHTRNSHLSDVYINMPLPENTRWICHEHEDGSHDIDWEDPT